MSQSPIEDKENSNGFIDAFSKLYGRKPQPVQPGHLG
jgi:hypothetical protein